ncbi:hypothetical protein ACIPW5_29590 [Streptomyces sp. NPDC090077]|uniref:hypothetical protein n=1 Tax=Streptomyces sp. NPDC090077 TaxID=3365938 RepID=UPI00382EA7D6
MEPKEEAEAELLYIVEQALRIRGAWEQVAMTHCCRRPEEVQAAYEVAARHWKVQLDERVVKLSSLWIGKSSYWE